MRLCSRTGLVVLAVALVVPLGGVAPSGAKGQDVSAMTREVVDIEGDAERLLSAPLREARLRSPTYVEERLTDGELFYRLQDYIRASIIFTDIVENHQGHRAFPDALFHLGDSLYRAGDLLGARTRFRQLIEHSGEQGYRDYLQRSLGRLIEIAIQTRDFDGVEDYFQRLNRLPTGEVEAATAYFRAKILYNRAVPTEDVIRERREGDALPEIDENTLERSRQAFEAVAEGSPYYPQARYYLGVIYTLRERFPEAIEAFRRVLRAPAETSEQRQVVELTQLALGRLYYETDQLDQAVEAYQAVPRTSPNFHIALYEIAWVFIRMGDATRAERALEVLVVAAPDSRFIPDAQLLRANLLLRNGRFDDANRLFRDVAREFGPVRMELDAVVAAHDDPAAYFRRLVRENMETFDAQAFLPPLAQRWASMEGDMDRALSVLGDLAQARRLVRETSELVERLDAALSQPNRVAVFGDLRQQVERSTSLRNRSSRVRRQLLASLERAGGGSAELGQVRQERRAIERFLDGMPTDDAEVAAFDEQVLGRYRNQERELGRLEVELQGMEARIVAMERYLEDTREQRDPAGVQAIQNELVGHRAALEEFRENIRQVRIQLESARLQVGPGDARYQRHSQLREEHARLSRRERELLGGQGAQIGALFDRMDRVEQRLTERERAIDAVVEERTADILRQLGEESERIVGYRRALTELEGETEIVVGGVTFENFRQVQERFYDIVLRADVGRIDVAWQRREEHRMRVELLSRDRARELQVLDDEFREIMDEFGDAESDDEELSP